MGVKWILELSFRHKFNNEFVHYLFSPHFLWEELVRKNQLIQQPLLKDKKFMQRASMKFLSLFDIFTVKHKFPSLLPHTLPPLDLFEISFWFHSCVKSYSHHQWSHVWTMFELARACGVRAVGVRAVDCWQWRSGHISLFFSSVFFSVFFRRCHLFS